ncbi:hypothetical protein N1030_11060 [Desulfovibrio mangrovi]|uniref:hypothetical protein n=1 Tax=Desulfovibrio mangrovi TaxID=2976983 RepID=UPI002248437C|nr:hypothetical protein [Desulfovibrio mangrovi]UZP66163.1 hypothetical protein N1030_11060 [Desulfovibrio mangrovi]
MNMPRAMRTAHLAMLQDALESGDVRTADYAVSELLCHAPDDGTVEAACVSVSGEPVLAAVRERLSRYRFRHVATLGSAVGGVPMSVACRPSCGTLYLADSGKNVVRRYTATGAELAPLDCGINKPLCIYSDGQDGVWICDYGNNRLVCLGKDDRIERAVDFSSYDVLKELQGRIRYGCAAGDRHYLVFAAEKTGGSVWAELRIGQAACTLRLHEPAGDVAPARVFRAGGELYFFAWPHAKAARIEAATRKRLPSGHGLSYPIVRGFVAVGTHRFLLSGNTVIKLDAEGELLFSYSLEKELGVLGVSALSMATGKRDGEDVLYISDGITGSVYVFAI